MKRFEVLNKGGKASIKLIGEFSWWENDSTSFIAQVDSLVAAGVTELECYINSPGGDMVEANEIGNQISRFTGNKSAKLGAICASAATIVSTYFDTVEASSNTQYMIHDPSARITIEHLSDIDSYRQLYENLLNDAVDRYHKKTGIDKEELKTMMRNTTWMSAAQAKEKKFVNSIGSDSAEMPSDAAKLFDRFQVPENIKAIISNSIKSTPSMKKLAAKFGLPEDATEDQILAAINEAERKLTLSAGNTEAGIKLLVATAESKGFKKETIEKLAKSDFAAAVELVSDFKSPEASPETAEKDKPETLRIADVVNELKKLTGNSTGLPEERKSWKLTDWEKNDPSGLQNMIKTTPDQYKVLFKAQYGYDITSADMAELTASIKSVTL